MVLIFSISQNGVEVAPLIPTVFTFVNQDLLMSLVDVTKKLFLFVSLQIPKSILPFELFGSLTKIIISWLEQKSFSLGIRFFTLGQIVWKALNCKVLP